MVILRGLIYLHNALDSSCIFGLLTSRQNVRLEMEKPIKNQIFWAKNSIEKNLENFDCNIGISKISTIGVSIPMDMVYNEIDFLPVVVCQGSDEFLDGP